MASTAGQMPRNLLGFDLRSVVRFAAGPSGRGDAFSDAENLTARAVAAAGLAALATLPVLLLSSVVLGAPLAVPAAIGLGYLAVSHALSAERHRRAAFINAIVLVGLVGWLFLFLLSGEGLAPRYGALAALLAPLFAAAPALARSWLAKKTARARDDVSLLREAALQRVACIDETMPAEQILVLDRAGSILAATAAARKGLGLLPDAIEYGLDGVLAPDELPQTLDAIRRCHRDGRPAEVELHVGTSAEPGLRAGLSPCGDGAVAMRVQALPRPGLAAAPPAEEITAPPEAPALPSCDVAPAVAFALRRLERKVEARGVGIASTAEPGLAINSDRQVGRRIVTLLLEYGLNACAAGGTIDLGARRVKGVALLRVAASPCEAHAADVGSENSSGIDSLRTLVEDAGGTLVIDRRPAELVLSVRLALARQDEFAK